MLGQRSRNMRRYELCLLVYRARIEGGSEGRNQQRSANCEGGADIAEIGRKHQHDRQDDKDQTDERQDRGNTERDSGGRIFAHCIRNLRPHQLDLGLEPVAGISNRLADEIRNALAGSRTGHRITIGVYHISA